jgi:hypothetical protein
MLQKNPETTKRFPKAVILGMLLPNSTKKKRSRPALPPDLQDIRMSPAVPTISSVRATRPAAVAQDGIQIMLEEDIPAGLVNKKFTLDRVINGPHP